MFRNLVDHIRSHLRTVPLGRGERRSSATRLRRLQVELLEDRCLPSGLSGSQALAAYGRIPLSFEINNGQTAAQVDFLAHGPGYGLFLTRGDAVLSLSRTAAAGNVVAMNLIGADPAAPATGLGELAATSNYFIGNDPAQWQINVANYGQVEYQDVYPGINLLYYGNQRNLEYDFRVAPGADPGVIQLAFTGVQAMSLDGQGNLVLETSDGDVVEKAPVVYQLDGNVRHAVSGKYVLEGPDRVGFAVGAYDTSRPLVIDPVLSYATYLGGSDQDGAQAIAVDSSGDAYITGYTWSTNFPTANPLQPKNDGSENVFVAKLNATGTALVYSTYLGGSGHDLGYGIAVDSSGDAYVTGDAASENFPTTPNAFQTKLGGADDAFVTELNPSGSALVYSTYLGGISTDEGYGIALDASSDAYITGWTQSTDFPTKNPLQPKLLGSANVFVTELNASGTALVYSTYLGGSTYDQGYGIAVDASGNAYVTGYTESSDFPTTANAFQTTFGGGGGGSNAATDAFVAKLSAIGTLVYSTYLGGSGEDEGTAIAVDSSGDAYVTGCTESTNFPTTPSAFQTTFAGGSGQGGLGIFGGDAFVTKLNTSGTALVYSTYLGGSTDDIGYGIAVDAFGDAHVTGMTDSNDFPTTANALQSTPSQGYGYAFLTKLNRTGTAAIYSSYLGGNDGWTYGYGIALDESGNAYVAGYSASDDFSTANSVQATAGGNGDAFVAAVSGLTTPSTLSFDGAAAGIYHGTASLTAVLKSGATPLANETVTFTFNGASVGTATTNADGVATLSASLGTLSVGTYADYVGARFIGDGIYAASSATTNLSVTPAPLTVMGITADDKVYDGTTTATVDVSGATLVGVFSGDSVTLNTSGASGAFASADVASGITVSVAGLTISGSQASDYALTQPTTTADITPADQTIDWTNPADIVYGTQLADAQLDATVSLVGPAPAGALTYSPAAGTVLKAGSDQTLDVTAAATQDYNVASANVSINVTPAEPNVTVSPVTILLGTPLSNSQLTGTATWTVGSSLVTVPGTFSYTTAAGTVLDAGYGQSESVTFTPTDTANYTPVVIPDAVVNVANMAITSPAHAIPGGRFAASVTVEVGAGQPQPSSVALRLAGAPAGVNLSGTLIAPVMNGVATFPNLSVNLAGTYSLFAAGSDDLIAAVSSPIVVTPTTHFSVRGVPVTQSAGQSFAVTVTALTATGSVDPTYQGTVRLTSTDPRLVVQGGDLVTFLPGDDGKKTVTVTLTTGGQQTITATDVTRPAAKGTSTPVGVTGSTLVPPATHLGITFTPSSITAGQQVQVTVTALNAADQTDTLFPETIHFASSDPQAVLPADYTFQPGDAGTRSFDVTLATAGRETITVTDVTRPTVVKGTTAVSVLAGAVSKFKVTGYPSPDVSGAAHVFTVKAVDAEGNTIIGYSGAVSLTSTDPLAVLPTRSYTFTAQDHGAHVFTAKLLSPGTWSLSAADTTNNLSGQDPNLTVLPAATHLAVSGTPSNVAAGQSFTITVTALTAANTTDMLFPDTIHFASNDPQAVLPADYTFLPGDAGTHSFSVTLGTAGKDTITVTDATRVGVKGVSVARAVTGTAPSLTAGIVGPTLGVRGQPLSFTLHATEGGVPAGTVFTYHITWGVGSPVQVVSGTDGLVVSHVYPVSGTDTARVTVVDPVGNVSPVASASPTTIQAVALETDPADDTRTALVVGGTTANDVISLTPANSGGTAVTVSINRVVQPGPGGGAWQPTGPILVYGQAGNDVIQVVANQSVKLAIPALLFAGTGNDTLSAAGSSADNVLVGGAGNSTLTGGSGRDILIGGGGAASLHAGGDNDILIGGSTVYDANVTALLSLLAEWGRTDRGYLARVQDLFGDGSGGLNGAYLLNGDSVIRHTAISRLFGGTAFDWLWFSDNTRAADQVNGYASGDVATFD